MTDAKALDGRVLFEPDAPALLSFLTIRDQIVCIDDLERRGQRLAVGGVLGLVSFLREQRACKVVLILNDEALKRACISAAFASQMFNLC